jgi:hypothetical protein
MYLLINHIAQLKVTFIKFMISKNKTRMNCIFKNKFQHTAINHGRSQYSKGFIWKNQKHSILTIGTRLFRFLKAFPNLQVLKALFYYLVSKIKEIIFLRWR